MNFFLNEKLNTHQTNYFFLLNFQPSKIVLFKFEKALNACNNSLNNFPIAYNTQNKCLLSQVPFVLHIN
jgi:hypothetical protein